MTTSRHLTEAERHDLADGTAQAEVDAGLTEHLAQCEACARDVAQVRELMTRIHHSPSPSLGVDLWPDIRARIEREKIVQLPETEARRPSTRLSKRPLAWALGAAAAAALLVFALPSTRRPVLAPTTGSAAAVELQLVSDSARVFEREATILLNELELRRAMLRPNLRSSLDRDLKTIDDAILELKDAIARDPNNAALRRLLAASYKQKVDLLKRVGG